MSFLVLIEWRDDKLRLTRYFQRKLIERADMAPDGFSAPEVRAEIERFRVYGLDYAPEAA